jgi:thioesterase domain-containing protein
VSGYVSLVRHLGPGQPAYGVRDVGEDRGRPIEQIAAEHLAAIRAVQPAGPYYLVGWSFGGLVAFEMGRQLQQQGETAALVGLMDTMANDLHQERPRGSDLELVLTLAGDVAARARRPFHLDPEALAGHDLEEQVRRAVEALHAQGAAPPGFDARELLEGCRIELDRDRSAADFAPDPYPGTVTLFRADDVPPPVAEHLARYDDEERRTLGWCRHALEVEVHPVPGSHPTIAREPHARALAGRMREALAAARARAGDEADAADADESPSSVEVLA